MFPDEFDVMISGGHRDKLLRRFGGAPLVSDAGDEEHKLLAVREVLRTCVPEPHDEPYDDAVRATWDGPPTPEWDDVVQRALPLLPEVPVHDGALDHRSTPTSWSAFSMPSASAAPGPTS